MSRASPPATGYRLLATGRAQPAASVGRAVAAIALAYAAAWLFWLVDAQPWPALNSELVTGALKIVLFAGVSVLAVTVMRRRPWRRALHRLGLTGAPWAGVRFGVLATVPMAVVALRDPTPHVGLDVLIGSALLGPIAEEVLFRGFLFTELHRRARWPLPWAILVSAAAFGVAHAPDLDGRLTDVILVTALGGVVFAWVYHRCRSLWPSIALHACLNLWWTLSRSPDVRIAVTPDVAGLAQVFSIALAVLLTLSTDGPHGFGPRQSVRPA